MTIQFSLVTIFGKYVPHGEMDAVGIMMSGAEASEIY